MKLNKLCNLTVLMSGLAFALVGCQIGPQRPTRIPGEVLKPKDESIPNPGLPLPPPVPGGGTEIDRTPPNPQGGHEGWSETAEALKAQSVYFELDKSAIKPSEQSKIEAVANYLNANRSKAVRVEGNCDERGTEEYNRSLGERRALSAREYLIHAGIDAARVDTITRGEDNPAVKGHNESAWSKNRRDEFIVLTPPGK